MEKGSACSKITTRFIHMINRKTLNTFQVLRAYILMCFFIIKLMFFYYKAVAVYVTVCV